MARVNIDNVTGSRATINTFGGYNTNNTAGNNEFKDMSGLDSHEYPYLTTRRKNELLDAFWGSKIISAVSYDKSVYFLAKDEQNHDEINLYVLNEYGEREEVADWRIKEIASDCTGNQQMVILGAELILFPQWIAYNVANTSTGDPLRSLQIKIEVSGTILFKMCDKNGISYDGDVGEDNTVVYSPSDYYGKEYCKQYGSFLLTEKDGVSNIMQYYSTNSMWMTVDSYLGIYIPYTEIDGAGSAEDAINNFGIEKDTELNWYLKLENMPSGFSDLQLSEQLLYKVTSIDDYVVFIFKGINKWEYTKTIGSTGFYQTVKLVTQSNGSRTISSSKKMVIKNELPSDLDFIISEGNRLFACSSKEHEIYACKLGDPRMWKQFAGISTDSYAATVGTPGQFTGAAVFNNVPIFFKENCIHRITGNTPASFNISYDYYDGVKIGSDKSIARVGNYLIYHSRKGFVYYTGSQPIRIDEQLGNNIYSNVIAGEKEGHYIAFSNNQILDYDMEKGVWYKHKNANYDVNVIQNASSDLLVFYEYYDDDREEDNFYIVDYGRNLNEYPIGDAVKNIDVDLKDGEIDFYAESGVIGLETMEHKYISRILFKMHLEFGSEISIGFAYDYAEDFEMVYQESNTDDKPKTITVPIIPRRAEHLRYKIEGTGNIIIYQISYDVAEGSEL